MIHELKVSTQDKDLRLDVWLERQLEGCSRSLVAKQIKAGRCSMLLGDGKTGKVKPAWKLRGDELITIEVPEMESLDIVAEELPLEIVYEDDDILLINKAPGMVVHPAIGHARGTLLNALLFYAQDKWQPLLVHRLDADTSGLIVVSKHADAQARMQALFKERQVNKRYLAFAHGSPKADYFERHDWIGRHPKDFRKRFAFKEEHPKAKHARSDFWVRQRLQDYVVLEVRIHTGRTHQIRVHLQAAGHPILADAVYGRSQQWPLNGNHEACITRQALHAWQLSFEHPYTNEAVSFLCPIANDLEPWLHQALKPLDAGHG